MTAAHTQAVAILSAGVVTAHGRGCLPATMLARAAPLVARTWHLRAPSGKAIAAGLAPDIPAIIHGSERLVALAVPALEEALSGVTGLGDEHRRRLPLLLAFPESSRVDVVPAAGKELWDALVRVANDLID